MRPTETVRERGTGWGSNKGNEEERIGEMWRCSGNREREGENREQET